MNEHTPDTQTDEKEQTNHEDTRESTLLHIADTLRNKRLDHSISMQDAEKALNIRQPYLQALESGDWSAMPGEVYALAFLRQYADYLKCDLHESIAKLKSNDYTLTKPITFPDPPIAPNRKWMVIFLIAFIGLLIAFNVMQKNTAPLPSAMLQENTQHMLDTYSQHTPDEPATPAAPQKTEPTPIPPIKLNSQPTQVIEPAPTPTTTTPQHPQATVSETAPDKQATELSAPVQHVYQLTATKDKVWLQVYTASSHTLLREALLKPGQHIQITSDQALSLTCGNPPALEVRVDDRITIPAGSLPAQKKVMRDFILPTSKQP